MVFDLLLFALLSVMFLPRVATVARRYGLDEGSLLVMLIISAVVF